MLTRILLVDAKAAQEVLHALLPVRLDNRNDAVRREALRQISRALTPVSEGGHAVDLGDVPLSEAAVNAGLKALPLDLRESKAGPTLVANLLAKVVEALGAEVHDT